MLLTALLCSSYSGSRGVQIHSHNDYQKNIPFYRAYSQQVNTIEADIYTAPASDDLLVAHDVQELSLIHISPISVPAAVANRKTNRKI